MKKDFASRDKVYMVKHKQSIERGKSTLQKYCSTRGVKWQDLKKEELLEILQKFRAQGSTAACKYVVSLIENYGN